MPRFQIGVTAADIENGVRHSPCRCPIAIAIARAIGIVPGWGEIDVGPDGIHLAGRGRLRKASPMLPGEAIRFLDDFDAGLPVEPIEFPLTIRIAKKA